MTDVGFIGLGVMGGAMARNVLKCGYRLHALDLERRALDALVAQGASAAGTPRDVAAASDVVITSLPDAPDVLAVALGPEGIVAGIRPGAIYIDMSTIDPATTRKVGAAIAARGAHMIDCPVGKTAEHAIAGTLTLMCGGPADVVARARPVLNCMGTDFFHCGGLGMGQAMKLANNLLATILMEANAEALVAGVKAGLTLEVMTGVMKTTMAWNNQLAIAMHTRALKGDFEPGFTLSLAHKDCRLAVKMNDDMGLPAPIGRALLEALEEGLASGAGGKDVGVLLKLREQEAGVEVRT